MANDVRIDRLKINIPGLSEAGQRRIAIRLAEALGAAGGLPQAIDIPRLRVAIGAGAERDEDKLTRLVVETALRDLARTP